MRDGFFKQDQYLGNVFDDVSKFLVQDPRTGQVSFPAVPVNYNMDKSDKIILGVTLGAIALGLFAVAYTNSKK